MGTQRTLTRRHAVAGLGCAAASLGLGACARRERPAVLRALSREVAVELAEQVRAQSRELRWAVRSDPDASRAALRGAIVAWKRAQALRCGPFAGSGLFGNATFWPARAQAIDAVLADDGVLDESRIEALPAHARGLYALEYLLCSERDGKKLAYASRVADNVVGYAERLARELGDGARFGDELAAGGQRSVSALAAHCLDVVDVVLGKLARLERARAERTPLAAAVEGYYSGSSREVVGALLDGIERVYVGGPGGALGALVRSASPDIDEAVQGAFIDVRARLGALVEPLERAAEREPVHYLSVARAVTALRHVVATGMLAALET